MRLDLPLLVMVLALEMPACGSESSSEGTEGAASRFCRAVSQHAAQCSGSPSACEKGLVDACSAATAVFSDAYLEKATSCVEGGDAPLTCLANATDGLMPTDAQKALAKSYCDACDPGVQNCADAFYASATPRSAARVALPLDNAAVDAIRTSCAQGAGCATGFKVCAQQVLASKGIAAATAGCLIDAWTNPAASENDSSCGEGGAGGGTATTTSSSATGGGGGTGPMTESACMNQTLALFPLALTQGDREFNGHGPQVDVTVDVTATSSTTISVKGCVTMKELVSDWTTGHSCVTKTFSHKNAGISGIKSFQVAYTDHDTDVDDAIAEHSELHPAPWVKSVECIGDRAGNDICSDVGCSRCDVAIGCIDVFTP